jgi:hypothetical protein
MGLCRPVKRTLAIHLPSPVDDDMPEDPQSNPISPPGLLSPVQIGPSFSLFNFPHVALDTTLSREGLH